MRVTTMLAVVASSAAVVFAVPVAARANNGNDHGPFGCIARPWLAGDETYRYKPGCSGHDEPELNPLSNTPGSASNLTWTVVLPKDGAQTVDNAGVLWFGGPVTDPRSEFGQAYEELQLYPDAMVTKCTNGGGFQVKPSPNTFTACSPVWSLRNGAEPAAFNAMLTDGTLGGPLVMHALDTVTIHFFETAARDGWHIAVTDVTTGHSGSLVLNSNNDGPLNAAYDVQQIGNSLGWGTVYDAPAAFVWEIGHYSTFAKNHANGVCAPGDDHCFSYEASEWAGMTPLRITNVTFDNGSSPTGWAVVSNQGGKAEVNQTCSAYGGPFCIFPWYSSTGTAFNYGVDYPATKFDYGQADQFAQTKQCPDADGTPNARYCDTVIKPGI
jgi:hypothetical protein